VNIKRKYVKLRIAFFSLILLLAGFWAYVEIINRNSVNMTGRQKLLKAFYPLVQGIAGLVGKSSKMLRNEKLINPFQPLDYNITLINGDSIQLRSLQGKKILLVNTASDCGYTGQYDDLQKLYEQYRDKLVVIGFPSNDFKEQEKGTDEEIAAFCKINYGVTFPLAKKSSVVKENDQNPVFEWLCDKNRNGWNNQQPTWNFSKYLINEQGVLTHYFDPAIGPLRREVIQAINQ
jgi:glutathione peroxidase